MKKIAAAALMVAAVSACGSPPPQRLKDVPVNTTVWIVGTDFGAAPGDRARVERKPDGKTWVVPADAEIRRQKDDAGNYKVEIKVTGKGNNKVFEVVNMNGVEVGTDGDSKIAKDERVATMKASDPTFEKV